MCRTLGRSESFQDETNRRDAVGILTSVLGDSRSTRSGWRAPGNTGGTATSAPRPGHGDGRVRGDGLRAADLPAAARPPELPGSGEHRGTGPWDSGCSDRRRFLVVRSRQAGRHELKLGRANYTELQRVSQINERRQFRFNTDFRSIPAAGHLSERPTIRMGASTADQDPHLRGLRAGQMEDGGPHHPEHRPPLRPRGIPIDEADNPLFFAGQQPPTDENNIAPRIGLTPLRRQGKSCCAAAMDVLQPHNPRRHRRHARVLEVHQSPRWCSFPNASADPGPGAGRFPTHPMLVNGRSSTARRSMACTRPGALIRNTGVVIFDLPHRLEPGTRTRRPWATGGSWERPSRCRLTSSTCANEACSCRAI